MNTKQQAVTRRREREQHKIKKFFPEPFKHKYTHTQLDPIYQAHTNRHKIEHTQLDTQNYTHILLDSRKYAYEIRNTNLCTHAHPYLDT